MSHQDESHEMLYVPENPEAEPEPEPELQNAEVQNPDASTYSNDSGKCVQMIFTVLNSLNKKIID